ncbi:unnamed protein product [Cunninghamella echinulata]
MEFEEVHQYLIHGKLRNQNYEENPNYNEDTRKKRKTISSKLAYGVRKIKNKLEGLSASSISASSDNDESSYATSSSSDEPEFNFTHLFKDRNKIKPINDSHSPNLSPIPNYPYNKKKPFLLESYLTNNNNYNNNEIVSSSSPPFLQKYHGSRSSTFSSTTTTTSSSSSTNNKLKNNKSYYSKRAKIKRHLGFFWRHHHHHYKNKLIKSNNNNNNNNNNNKIWTAASSSSIKIQTHLSNLTYSLNPSHDNSLLEKEIPTVLKTTSNELLNQLSNDIQRLQCLIDIEIQSIEEHQRDILFYTNQLEQLDQDIDYYLHHKIKPITMISEKNIIPRLEEIQDWYHPLLSQLQLDHHLILSRFESYMRSILSKNTLHSLQVKTEMTLKNIHQMNVLSYWSLLFALFFLLCIFIYWFIYYASIFLFLICLLLSIMIIYSVP